jgi:hypothetical protein
MKKDIEESKQKMIEGFEELRVKQAKGNFICIEKELQSFLLSKLSELEQAAREEVITSLIEWAENKLEDWASDEHNRWAGWQAYLFSKSEWTKDGYLIPKDLCERWQRQIDTPYEKLLEQEKESDRKEVRKYLDDIISYLQSQLKRLN